MCGMQVPRSKSVRPHPISGMARINLTFRRLDLQSAARAPSCKCGQKAVLKVYGCIGILPSSSANVIRRLYRCIDWCD